MRDITLFIAKCLLLVGGIALVVVIALWFEDSRPAPEYKPGPTVLEIGE